MENKKYQPSNSTEGDIFRSKFCYQCLRDKDWREREVNPCQIQCKTALLNAGDEDYPQEWTYDTDGNPICTAFEPNPVDLLEGTKAE